MCLFICEHFRNDNSRYVSLDISRCSDLCNLRISSSALAKCSSVGWDFLPVECSWSFPDFLSTCHSCSKCSKLFQNISEGHLTSRKSQINCFRKPRHRSSVGPQTELAFNPIKLATWSNTKQHEATVLAKNPANKVISILVTLQPATARCRMQLIQPTEPAGIPLQQA